MNKRIISSKILSRGNKYNYCPWCMKKWQDEGGGKDWAEKLPTLKLVKLAEPIQEKDGSIREVITEHYECIKCGASNITENTFVVMYCCRADGTKYNEPPKEPGTVWSKTKNCLVPAKWDQLNRKWVEIIDNPQNKV